MTFTDDAQRVLKVLMIALVAEMKGKDAQAGAIVVASLIVAITFARGSKLTREELGRILEHFWDRAEEPIGELLGSSTGLVDLLH